MTDNTYRLPVIETVKAAWAKVSGTKGSFWAVIGIFLLVQIVVSLFAEIGKEGSAIDIIFSLIGSIVQIIATASLLYLGIRRAQDLPIQYKMIRDVCTARLILCVIGLYILQLIIVALPAMLLFILGMWLLHLSPEPSIAMQVLAVLCYVVGFILLFYLSVRTWLGYGAVVDKKLNPWAALCLSFRATTCNVWNLIGLYFITFLIIIVCALTLGIGLIWGIPWLLILYGETYKRLSTRQDIRPAG